MPMPKGLAYTGYVLALIGGIILIITAGLGLLGVIVGLPRLTLLEATGSFARDFFVLVLGIVATVGARFTNYLGWDIGLIIIGLVAGDLGGILVLIGGILGLVQYLTKR